MVNDDDLSAHVRKIAEGIDEIKKAQKNLERKIIRYSAITAGIILVITMASVAVYDTYYLYKPEASRSGFIIEGLRGDSVETWVYWLLASYQELDIHLLDSPFATDTRVGIIRDAIMSKRVIKVNDMALQNGHQDPKSVYYMGWKGALDSIKVDTEVTIPNKIHFDVVDSEQGQVIIKLTNEKNMDGFSAFTKSIIDESNHQVVKSTITIYEINKISNEQLATVVRHEMGHVLGLAHSTAREDLMAPFISVKYPYISQCDVDAVRMLYDGNQKSRVVCER